MTCSSNNRDITFFYINNSYNVTVDSNSLPTLCLNPVKVIKKVKLLINSYYSIKLCIN